jgi:hypothetical protein
LKYILHKYISENSQSLNIRTIFIEMYSVVHEWMTINAIISIGRIKEGKTWYVILLSQPMASKALYTHKKLTGARPSKYFYQFFFLHLNEYRGRRYSTVRQISFLPNRYYSCNFGEKFNFFTYSWTLNTGNNQLSKIVFCCLRSLH